MLIAVAGWMNQHQLQIIDYLREENRVLRQQLGGRRVRFNDDQRRDSSGSLLGTASPVKCRNRKVVVAECNSLWIRRPELYYPIELG